MPIKRSRSNELQDHVFNTYLSLRTGLWATGALLPFVIWFFGWAFDHKPLQKSISAYYWTTANEATGEYRARTILVGGLFAIALGLYLYKGFTKWEDIALNLAAIFCLGVALFPTTRPGQLDEGFLTFHGLFAILLFFCLAYVVWTRALDTLHLLRNNEAKKRYRRTYLVIGLVMLASPLAAIILNLLTFDRTSFVFWTEAAGIWAFALYWYVKSRELKETKATRRALQTGVQLNPLAVEEMP